ncbi:uncharacterized protein ACA1_036220 [Acanthamoeba castellanii str. Neff]|uniref:Uncharacterized protein n=1 Tax=Acanthamoeba castellanii (strain ATCC 30010 / Neff) TaxID=1257118 RepID=L8HDU4_ACACF|nr:uncharacterized protein ACA1_036220 [Acanthamoeba castellanii str. Neff]ELR22933.1 hypothetical protein ACA1_036220 [Acanthamoeba castellanii str. Neff]
MDKGKTNIQRDWEQREFIEDVTVNIKKVTEFLNRFDISTRYKLARINEKLSKLERQMDYLEAALKTVSGGGDGGAAAE